MLKSLLIKNFAIIDNLELIFSQGFNIITGETGAGKSIIVDALMLALGERASSDIVRSGENKAVIEAVFEKTNFNFLSSPDDELNSILIDYDLKNYSDELILRREIYSKGNSRCFINDTPANVSQLKLLGDFLVDFHGQYDHQLLLKPENHILILDDKSNLSELIQLFSLQLEKLKLEIKKYQKLKIDRQNFKELAEKYNQELTEIELIAPQENEEEKLELQLKKIENFEQIYHLLNSILNSLADNNDSVYNTLNIVIKDFEKLIKFVPEFSDYLEESKSHLISIKEITNHLRDYASSLEIENEMSPDEIRIRLSKLKALRKKYGAYNNIIQKRDELKKNIDLIDNIDFEIEKSKSKINELKIECGSFAKKISEIRQSAASLLEIEILDNLLQLGMPDCNFKVNITNIPFRNRIDDNIEFLTVLIDDKNFEAFHNGIDKIEFLISTNKGEELKPLSEIASGGEISRVMLAIKSISSAKSNLPILIFDEIDIGISGRIARKVGIAMRKLSEKNQVIAITHLPQIASLAENHINVKKFETNGRAIVSVSTLNYEERIQEIARLISGEIVTEASIKAAEELIEFD